MVKTMAEASKLGVVTPHGFFGFTNEVAGESSSIISVLFTHFMILENLITDCARYYFEMC